jgi:hypothetical protein
MLVTLVENRVHVTLSRRNLRDLDAILDAPDVAKRCLARTDENGVSLVVEVEDDAEHYESRGPGPGLRPGEIAHQPQQASHP